MKLGLAVVAPQVRVRRGKGRGSAPETLERWASRRCLRLKPQQLLAESVTVSSVSQDSWQVRNLIQERPTLVLSMADHVGLFAAVIS